MIFPKKTDYPGNLSILEHHNDSESRFYLALVESSASAYFEADFFSQYFFKKRFLIAKDFLEKKGKFQRVLDAGTGIGFFLPYLSSIAEEVVGVEKLESVIYSRKMIQNRGISNVIIDQYDLLSLPYKESSFDLITAFSVLDRFSPIEMNIIINSFRRILKPGGFLITGLLTENRLVFFLRNRLDFLFSRRRRTRQILEILNPSKKILYPYIQKKGEIENLILDRDFSKEYSKDIEILNLINLYKVNVFKNCK